MHFDTTISLGNILTALAMLGTVAVAINRHNMTTLKLASSMEANSNATNNLAAITERLQRAVELQDSRLVHLETEQRISAEVAKQGRLQR